MAFKIKKKKKFFSAKINEINVKKIIEMNFNLVIKVTVFSV
jgi:hypothetical protein